MEPAIPGVEWSLEVRLHSVHIIKGPRELVSELMTEIAAGFERVDPVILSQHADTDTIALSTRAGKEIRRRGLHERQPVIARVDLSSFLWRLGRNRFQSHGICARLRLNLR